MFVFPSERPVYFNRFNQIEATVGLIVLAMFGSCGGQVQRFPLTSPRWEDADRRNVKSMPDEYFSGLIADGSDKIFFRPLARLPYFPLSERAHNVNAMDEVPNSSWFQNRIGFYPITPEQAARAACGDDPPLDPKGPWTVVAAKPDGANPGFFIEANGIRYLLKFDDEVQPPRATSADVIGSKIYWTAGYYAPCNEIVYFKPDILRFTKKSKTKDQYGDERSLTSADVDKILTTAFRLKDGTLRASASRFLPGRPLGPFRYEDTRSDDPNDRIPHEHRRELRGGKILAAWLNHHDAREENTLDMWVEQNGRHYVRHHIIDFGDCFGGRWDWDSLSRRLGHAYVVDWEYSAEDYLTLGIWPRPWYKMKPNSRSEIFSYFSDKDFVASKWKTNYPNAAFIESRYDDDLWMARIVSRFTDDHIRAIVKTGRFENPRDEQYLVDTLIKRRDKILREYFTQYAPFDRFRLVRRTPGDLTQSLCFEDLAIKHGLVDPRSAIYKIRFYGGMNLERQLGWLQFQPDPEHPFRSCIKLPLGDQRPASLALKGAPDDDPLRYGVMKIWIHQHPSIQPTSAIHLYFYDLGQDRGYQLVGIERPDRPVVPRIY
jgi:hypothetical protein